MNFSLESFQARETEGNHAYFLEGKNLSVPSLLTEADTTYLSNRSTDTLPNCERFSLAHFDDVGVKGPSAAAMLSGPMLSLAFLKSTSKPVPDWLYIPIPRTASTSAMPANFCLYISMPSIVWSSLPASPIWPLETPATSYHIIVVGIYRERFECSLLRP